jgi:hypothetical protein
MSDVCAALYYGVMWDVDDIANAKIDSDKFESNTICLAFDSPDDRKILYGITIGVTNYIVTVDIEHHYITELIDVELEHYNLIDKNHKAGYILALMV